MFCIINVMCTPKTKFNYLLVILHVHMYSKFLTYFCDAQLEYQSCGYTSKYTQHTPKLQLKKTTKLCSSYFILGCHNKLQYMPHMQLCTMLRNISSLQHNPRPFLKRLLHVDRINGGLATQYCTWPQENEHRIKHI